MEEEQKNVCSLCGNFERYFLRGYCSFSKADYGWCCKRRRPTERRESCEHFRKKLYRRKRSNRMIDKVLCDMNAKLEQLIQVLTAEQDEDQN
ncbi:MAG: hypothetical protein K2H43_05670 [Clostridia bacterium]|nr:hypothetical protein [Clostridia bacterium]